MVHAPLKRRVESSTSRSRSPWTTSRAPAIRTQPWTATPPAAAGWWIQPKLEVGAPNDEFEREADARADEVMAMDAAIGAVAGAPAGEVAVAQKQDT